MARNRMLSPDFWTWEAVIDCTPMTRLLFLGLWNFADDHGVQPLRPRTIRLQVFPGDDIDNEAVRAMIDELAARQLVRIYEVEGLEYLAIVDWAMHQRVSKRARRRFPSPCEDKEKVPSVSKAVEEPLGTIANHGIGEASQSPSALRAPSPSGPSAAPDLSVETIANHSIGEASQSPTPALRAPSPSGPSAATDLRGEKEDEPARWRGMIKGLLGLHWPRHARIEQSDDAAAERWTAKWIAEGCDYPHDIVPAVRDFYVEYPFGGPPTDLRQLDEGVTGNRIRREARERARVAA